MQKIPTKNCERNQRRRKIRLSTKGKFGSDVADTNCTAFLCDCKYADCGGVHSKCSQIYRFASSQYRIKCACRPCPRALHLPAKRRQWIYLYPLREWLIIPQTLAPDTQYRQIKRLRRKKGVSKLNGSTVDPPFSKPVDANQGRYKSK